MYLNIILALICFSTKVLSIDKLKTEPARHEDKMPPTEFSSNPLLRTKRSEIDLQTCIDNFNVHRDKIIRTQDSQNMGAKYLNEIDLGSREECLRLCCETEDCDVFVFEEKNSGSCYLFHCGPPEDFKCKFTHHVNYSSAVLSINRHMPDLESQIKLTKHIQDLSKLRKPGVDSQNEVLRMDEIKTTTTSTQPPVITKEVIPIEKQPEATRKCSRYQFECRSTGECIAIYNACDGIPQCADGSDEGHELGCPALEAVAASAVAQPTALPTTKETLAPPAVVERPQHYGREGELVQQPPKPQQSPANYQNLYHSPSQNLPQIPIQPESDFLRPVADLRVSPVEQRRSQYDPLIPVPNYMGFGNNWGPGRQGPAVPQLNPYQDGGNAMYPRKEKVPQNEGQVNQLQYPEYSGRLGNYYGENYRQPVQQENWPIDDSRYPQQPLFHPQETISLVPAKTEGTSHVVEPVQVPDEHEKPLDPVVNSKHVQEKLAHDLKHSKEHMDHGSNQKSKPKEEILHPELLYPQATYRMIDDTRDGFAHVPRGAILSLTLGLIITAVMAILIGCRLRVVRKRLRKGGKGYAHDADYLVNGMYL